MVDAGLVRLLESKGVEFCVIGAAAMAAHGWARYTADVDLLTMDRAVLEPDFWPASFHAEIHRADPDDPLGGVVRLGPRGPHDVPHDLILGRGFAMKYAVETRVDHRELGCAVATPVAVVLLKLEAGGPQDRLDAIAFVQTQKAIDGAPWLAGLDELVAACSAEARAVWATLKSQV